MTTFVFNLLPCEIIEDILTLRTAPPEHRAKMSQVCSHINLVKEWCDNEYEQTVLDYEDIEDEEGCIFKSPEHVFTWIDGWTRNGIYEEQEYYAHP